MALDHLDAAHSILLLEDDASVRRLLARVFADAGYWVREAASVEGAMTSVRERGLPALAVVDLMLEGESGEVFCRRVQEFSDLPVVVLTAVTESGSATAAIQRFAEDYVRKPFDPLELLARVERVLRRMGAVVTDPDGRLRLGPDITIDLAGGVAWRRGVRVALTPTECRLLHILARNAGRTVETETLLRRLWPDQTAFADALRVHVHRLRRKIEIAPEKPALLITERGLGYRLQRGS